MPTRTSRPAKTRPTEDAFLDQMADHCRARGASLTPIRRRVLAMLRGRPGGVKAYDLLEEMKQEHPGAAPPTIYRALDFLIEQGLAHKIGRNNLFVACNHETHSLPSLFLVCPECGRVTEVQDPEAVSALHRALAATGHRLVSSDVEIGAVCPGCQEG